jgi:hypothetical protein
MSLMSLISGRRWCFLVVGGGGSWWWLGAEALGLEGKKKAWIVDAGIGDANNVNANGLVNAMVRADHSFLTTSESAVDLAERTRDERTRSAAGGIGAGGCGVRSACGGHLAPRA